MLAQKPIAYYSALPQERFLTELNASAGGLSERDASQRLVENGPNEFAEKREFNLLLELVSRFKSPLVLILLTAAIVSYFFGATLDSIIIGLLIILSVTIDFFLEYRASSAAEALKESVKTHTLVLRSGKPRQTDKAELVPGDIVMLSAGSVIPADARILVAKHFFVNQASLTGESFPVQKTAERSTGMELALTELNNMVFLGAHVVSGSAIAVIVKTGRNTQFGAIAEKLFAAKPPTEFDKGITSFGYLIMRITFFLVLFIFMFNSILSRQILQSFMFAVAIVVGLTPELLPMIMSVTMAEGSQQMAKKGVIVKKLTSIPNFGSMDILCTDKTGTLTEDKIQLMHHTDAMGNDSAAMLKYAYLTSVYQTGIKNPLDDAILRHERIDIAGYEKIDEIPFDFTRKKMSVVVRSGKKLILVTKGAPEELFRCATNYLVGGKPVTLAKRARAQIHKQYEDYSNEGLRVLAIGIREVPSSRTDYSVKDECGLTLVGFLAFHDPPKHDAHHTIRDLADEGIEVKILTGDNEIATQKICRDIGVPVSGVLLGYETEGLNDDALRMKALSTTIFARFSPDQKNRVIRVLKAGGHVVGYLGDGINDAPSLREADIGISVNSAADVAKESADIVLTHKSLLVLKEGVLEGRKTFANTMKYVMMGLSSNFGNMFSVAAAVLFLPFLPMLPTQILLNNFIYDFSQIPIPSDNVDKEFMRKPKRWNMKFIKEFMLTFGPLSSLFDIFTFILLFFVLKLEAPYFQTGWFVESLATQTLVVHIIRTKKIPFITSTPSLPLLIATIISVCIAWVLPYTPFAAYFGLVPLPWYIICSLAGLVLVYLLCAEVLKRHFYRRHEF